ncbi:phosphopentomutase [Myxococcota bacterium]|nr:phosphopentomutase [Myxococcota bacterium]MBU1534859.1 phosphopentomutase [Myxococcota bacterium]
MKRVLLIVLDSVGIGAARDASEYGDAGSDTLGHIADRFHQESIPFDLPNLAKLGLAHLKPQVSKVPVEIQGSYGILEPRSIGKDTTTGHWEMVGVILREAFPTYPQGFPAEITSALEKATGVKYLGNKASSGTTILEELGERSMLEHSPILYTSADSVLQIAAHEDIFSIKELYLFCEKAREIADQYKIGRVIARPYTGEKGSFTRTPRRHDYSMTPPPPTVLNAIVDHGLPVEGVGKIFDIFNGAGITASTPTTSNANGIAVTMERFGALEKGLLFVNLVDFDMLYGHRNNWRGYGDSLMEFDRALPEILSLCGPDDMLLITADHGNDPTWPGTDHCRENVPLLVYTPGQQGMNLGTRRTFADVGATVARHLDVPWSGAGVPVL